MGLGGRPRGLRGAGCSLVATAGLELGIGPFVPSLMVPCLLLVFLSKISPLNIENN